uniref:Uncharacterized protein n=1 Tax=Timema cristinae TaxID=61476 RepID=A0A7R9CYV7_TIMCR|nr:unnamed protein product [Timema cristinae]
MFCPCGSVDRQRRLAMLFLLLRTVVIGVLVGVVTSEATPVESDTQAMLRCNPLRKIASESPGSRQRRQEMREQFDQFLFFRSSSEMGDMVVCDTFDKHDK